MSIHAIIWDLGGVLVRTEDYSGRIQWAEWLGIQPQVLEDYVFSSESGRSAQAGEISDEQHWQNVADHFCLTAPQLNQFRSDFSSGDRLDRDLVEYIRGLRSQYKTALLSNNFSELRHELRKRWQIEDIFDTIVISAEVRLLKPGAEIFLRTINSLNIAADEAIFIDDFEQNILGAQAVGLHTVHFRNRLQVCAEVEKYLRQ